MLDDDAGGRARRIELRDTFVGRIGVVDVVVGELLALHLAGGGNAGAQVRRAVERRRLVRVLAVAQRFDQAAAESAESGHRIAELLRKPIADGGVIGGGARIRLGGKLATQVGSGSAAMGGQLAEQRA